MLVTCACLSLVTRCAAARASEWPSRGPKRASFHVGPGKQSLQAVRTCSGLGSKVCKPCAGARSNASASLAEDLRTPGTGLRWRAPGRCSETVPRPRTSVSFPASRSPCAPRFRLCVCVSVSGKRRLALPQGRGQAVRKPVAPRGDAPHAPLPAPRAPRTKSHCSPALPPPPRTRVGCAGSERPGRTHALRRPRSGPLCHPVRPAQATPRRPRPSPLRTQPPSPAPVPGKLSPPR